LIGLRRRRRDGSAVRRLDPDQIGGRRESLEVGRKPFLSFTRIIRVGADTFGLGPVNPKRP
jgi:hypothetical protein